MREFLEYVAGQLIDSSTEMALTEEAQGETRAYILHLPASEVGKIIGKQGHTIRAIRNLVGAAASRHGGHVTFEVVESVPAVE